MSITRRGKVSVVVVTTLVAVGGALGYFALFPDQAPAIVRTTLNRWAHRSAAAAASHVSADRRAGRGRRGARPTGARREDRELPGRATAGRPAVGGRDLRGAGRRRHHPLHRHLPMPRDTRLGPVRSARTVDPQVLSQLGVPILAYSGARRAS